MAMAYKVPTKGPKRPIDDGYEEVQTSFKPRRSRMAVLEPETTAPRRIATPQPRKRSARLFYIGVGMLLMLGLVVAANWGVSWWNSDDMVFNRNSSQFAYSIPPLGSQSVTVTLGDGVSITLKPGKDAVGFDKTMPKPEFLMNGGRVIALVYQIGSSRLVIREKLKDGTYAEPAALGNVGVIFLLPPGQTGTLMVSYS